MLDDEQRRRVRTILRMRAEAVGVDLFDYSVFDAHRD